VRYKLSIQAIDPVVILITQRVQALTSLRRIEAANAGFPMEDFN